MNKNFVWTILAGLLLLAGTAQSQSYPEKAIRMVVPHAPGSAADIRARQVAERLSKSLGQNVFVENRPGAGGTIGAIAVARAQPDGYTLLYGSSSELAVAPSAYPSLGYDPTTDFSPISQAARGPGILVVSSSLGVKTVSQLVALAKAKPQGVTGASGGIGTTTHLLLLELMAEADIELTHVPYKNVGQALLEVISGQVNVMFEFASAARPHIQAGRVVPLMVSSAERIRLLPNVPTAREAGLPGVSFSGWNGLLAPKGTPRPIIERLSREFIAVMRSADMTKIVSDLGSEVVASTPEEFAAFIAADVKRVRDIVKRTGVKLE